MKFLLIVLAITMFSALSPIHQDTVLQLDQKGNVKGLPKKYGPAMFNQEDNYLRLGNKEVFLPNCISYYFSILQKPKLKITASWYHSKDIMPYYINFSIYQKGENFGYSVLLDLETLELIEVEVHTSSGDSRYSHDILIKDYCIAEYESGIRTVTK